MNIITLGGTGLIGGLLLEKLAAEPLVTKVYSLSRRPLPLKLDKIEERVGPLSELGPLLAGVKASQAVSCLGTTIKQAGSQAAFAAIDRDLTLSFARGVRAMGVQHFHLVSSLGAEPESRNFYLRIKGEVEASLASLGFESLHIYRPSLLLGSRSEKRLGEEVAARAFRWVGPLLRGPLLNYRPIEAETVAAFILSQLREARPGVHVWENRSLHGF